MTESLDLVARLDDIKTMILDDEHYLRAADMLIETLDSLPETPRYEHADYVLSAMLRDMDRGRLVRFLDLLHRLRRHEMKYKAWDDEWDGLFPPPAAYDSRKTVHGIP